MDILTRYRPVRSLEFYQRKAVRFIYSSEGSDDIRTLTIPFGELGFDSPLHFIRCIPPILCEDFVCDKLFQRMDNTLRKGIRVFVTCEDGRLQSAVYKGQRIDSSDGVPKAILDGHRVPFPESSVVPYKAFLRKNVGTLLENETHKFVGILVPYEEAKWDVGDPIYFKPSKRWGTILDREVIRGKVLCGVKLDQTKFKKAKFLKVPLYELMTDAVAYKVPLILKDTPGVIEKPQPQIEIEAATQVETKRSVKPSLKSSEHSQTVNGKGTQNVIHVQEGLSIKGTDTINRNKLTKQQPKNTATTSKSIAFPKASTEESDSSSGGSGSRTNTSPLPPVLSPKGDLDVAVAVTGLNSSPKSPLRLSHDVNGHVNDEEFIPVIRRTPPQKTMRPLTEYFHNSTDVQSDSQSSPNMTTHSIQNVKCKSVNNLSSQVVDDEEEENAQENYRNSLRRSAKGVLAIAMAKQMADEAVRHRNTLRKNEFADNSPSSLSFGPRSMPTQGGGHFSTRPYTQYDQRTPHDNHREVEMMPKSTSTSANDTSGTESPPPLPVSPPPLQQSVPHDDYAYGYDASAALAPSNSFIYHRSASMVEDTQLTYDAPPVFRKGVQSTSDMLMDEDDAYGRQHPAITHLQQRGVTFASDYDYAYHSLPINGEGVKPAKPSTIQNGYDHRPPTRKPPSTLQHALSVPSVDMVDSQNATVPRTRHSKGDKSKGPPLRGKEGKMNTVERIRYKKNPNAKMSKVRSVPNIVDQQQEQPQKPREPPLPHPFSLANVQDAYGKSKGIQTGCYSNYADVSIFSLFYCSKIFDKLLTGEDETDKGLKLEVKRIIRNRIVRPLRLYGYCGWESVCHLREAMMSLSSKLNSPFMDAEEFLYLLFDNALKLPDFINYNNGSREFMHQIIVKPKDRSRCQDIQFLLETSMEINSLKFTDTPSPALFVTMPRCNGRLVYYEAIIPTMKLNLTPLIEKGPKKCLCEKAATLECAMCYKKYGDMALSYCQSCQRMSEQIHYHIGHSPVLVDKQQADVYLHLLAVICLKNNHYSAFVKTGTDRLAPWLFYEAIPTESPEVYLLEDFSRWLDRLEKEPGRYRDYAKTNPYLKRLITESHICIYYSPERSSTQNENNKYAESFIV